MFSKHLIRCPHDGQLDGGLTRLPPLGSLHMQTLRKLPMQAPKAKTKAEKSQNPESFWNGCICDYLSPN